MKTKKNILFCTLWILAALTISGCTQKAPTLDDDGYRALIDLLTTERSPENETQKSTDTDTEAATKEPKQTQAETTEPTSDETTEPASEEASEPLTEAPSSKNSVEPITQPATESVTTVTVAPPQPAAPFVYRPDYFYSSTYYTTADSLVFSPQEIYFEGESLHAIMYIYNGHATTAANIHDVYLSFDNGITAIAAASFDSLSGCAIAPHCYVLWEFIFPAEGVFLRNTNLGSVNTTYRSSYTY